MGPWEVLISSQLYGGANLDGVDGVEGVDGVDGGDGVEDVDGGDDMDSVDGVDGLGIQTDPAGVVAYVTPRGVGLSPAGRVHARFGGRVRIDGMPSDAAGRSVLFQCGSPIHGRVRISNMPTDAAQGCCCLHQSRTFSRRVRIPAVSGHTAGRPVFI